MPSIIKTYASCIKMFLVIKRSFFMSAMVDMSWANDHIIPNPEVFNHFFLEIPNRSRWVLLAQTFFGERASHRFRNSFQGVCWPSFSQPTRGVTLPETNIFAPETLETWLEDEFPFRVPGLLLGASRYTNRN